jgi:hypothetical protein
MNTPMILTDTWQQLATSASVLVVQARVSAQLYVGSSPTASDIGFELTPGEVSAIPNLSDLGGEVWARGVGVLSSASA